jgi:crescentin
MSKISDFLARKAAIGDNKGPVTVNNAAAEAFRRESEPEPEPVVEITTEGGSRLGAENEALRGLVVEAARKIEDLDSLKLAFGRIIDPLQRTLVALEQEKSHNASLFSTLSESRSTGEALRAELQQRERAAASLAAANEKLQHEVEATRQTVGSLDSTRIELLNEIANKNNEIADLETKLSAESISRHALADEHRLVSDQAQTSGKRLGVLEAEIVAARQKLALSDDERRSLHNSLDQTVNEVSRISRLLAESNNGLATTQTRLAQLETSLAETEAERTRLLAALDEANERHRAESSAQTMRLDALQSRAATAEKLLVEARSNLAARADELRIFDRKMTDSTIARNAAEKKLAQLEGSQQTQERQIKDLEQARAALVERNTALGKNMRTRETELARAEEKIASTNDLISRMEAEIGANRSRTETRIEELNAQLERERMDRAVAEGALEATRKDNARLARENTRLETAIRQADDVANGKRKSTVEPIIKS